MKLIKKMIEDMANERKTEGTIMMLIHWIPYIIGFVVIQVVASMMIFVVPFLNVNLSMIIVSGLGGLFIFFWSWMWIKGYMEEKR